MRLYFLRHAEAEDGPVDALRALTRKGRRDARRMGSYLALTEVRFTAAFCSPLVRARETAELVLAKCVPVRGVQLARVEQLLNETSAAGFGRWIKGFELDAVVLMVGHEPSLGMRVRSLMGLPIDTSLPLSKGMVARVDTDDGRRGTLKLLIGPKQLP